MDIAKIIDIAYEFADGECELMFSEVALINFVKSVIDEMQAEKSNSNNQETMSIDGSLSLFGTNSDIKFNSNGNESMSIDGSLSSIGTESPDNKLTVNTGQLPAGISPAYGITPGYITFQLSNSPEIMRLDKDGMIFMGERITDAGEAYDAWMKAMSMMQGK